MPLLLTFNKFSVFKAIFFCHGLRCTHGANTCSKAVLWTLEQCDGAIIVDFEQVSTHHRVQHFTQFKLQGPKLSKIYM